MKTVEEFIQRLHNDPEFEHKAQAYENSQEFIEFVKHEGYDFTLDQLLDKFQPQQELPPKSDQESAVALKTLEEFIQRLDEDSQFESKARSYENDEAFMEFLKSEGYDFTLDQLMGRFKDDQSLLRLQSDKSSPPFKGVDVPSPQLAGGSPGENLGECVPDGEIEPQKRPGALYPKFEAGHGGRRRGMKWLNIEDRGNLEKV
jgi:predicted ribosomally synthesized peptide with nif11-like leader